MSKLIQRYYLPLLFLILAFAFFTRIWRLQVPDRYVFDEVYHAITAKLIARNDVRAYEWWNQPVEKDTAVDWLHPPLAKYTQALSMLIFGENSFGWRLSSAIFGVLVIAAVAKLSQELFQDKAVALLAAWLASLDGLLLTQSRIAMNDIHVTFFILLTLICYVNLKKLKLAKNEYLPPQAIKYYILTGLSAGLAMGSKWSGLYVLILVLIFEGIELLRQALIKNKKHSYLLIQNSNFSKFIRKLLLVFISLIILPIVIYVFSYTHMFLQGKSLICWQEQQVEGVCYFERFKKNDQTIWEGYLSHFFELHRQIWWYQTNLKATHSYQSRPWQWFLDLKPVWYYVDYENPNQTINIYAFGNPILFWIGDIAVIFTLGYITINLAININRKKLLIKFLTANFSLLLLLTAYFIVWLPWQLSPRIMFFYHYTPAVPLLCILLSYWLVKLSLNSKFFIFPSGYKIYIGQLITSTCIIAIALTFLIWYPHWTALPVSKDWATTFYFAIPSWK